MRSLITVILVLFLTNLRSQNETKIILTEGIFFKNDQITGNVKKHTFFSKILNNEREVYVWIPEDYNLKNKKYPLLIAHDGGVVFYSEEEDLALKINLKLKSLKMVGILMRVLLI